MPRNVSSTPHVTARPSNAPVTSRTLVWIDSWYSAWPKASVSIRKPMPGVRMQSAPMTAARIVPPTIANTVAVSGLQPQCVVAIATPYAAPPKNAVCPRLIRPQR